MNEHLRKLTADIRQRHDKRQLDAALKGLASPPPTWQDVGALFAALDASRAALRGLLDHYTELVNCGDCGNWDPEEEAPVIAARECLKS